VPGVIQAEDYRPGAAGSAYRDTTDANQGGAYRSDAVDIKSCVVGSVQYGCYVVGWLRDGEWLEYDIWVEQAGAYEIGARVAGPFDGRGLELAVDGDRVGEVDVPATGGFHRWESVTSDVVAMTEGLHTFRITIGGGGFLLDALDFRPT
jgi:hypothetical protein